MIRYIQYKYNTNTTPAPTRHLGANNGYASNNRYFIIKNYTFFSTTKCRVGGLKVEVVDQYIKISMLVRWVPEDSH